MTDPRKHDSPRESTHDQDSEHDHAQHESIPIHSITPAATVVDGVHVDDSDLSKRNGRHSPPLDRHNDSQYAPIIHSPASGQTCR